MIDWQRWRSALKHHYTAPLYASFKQFRLGVALFFLGLVILYGGTQILEPSITQELVVALAILVIACGFTVAMMAHVRMVISRVLRFWFRR